MQKLNLNLNSIFNIDLLIKILSLTLLYVFAGKAGQVFSLVGGTVSLIWLPSGIALSAMLIFGRKLWAGIFLGVFFANIDNNLPFLTIVVMGIGSSLGAIVGSLCLEKRLS
ncbi:MAG: MASE1 domain-containing protein [Dolichospermum sp.]|nr:MASE1 domain-containing protein [Dolichospermum sp.]